MWMRLLNSWRGGGGGGGGVHRDGGSDREDVKCVCVHRKEREREESACVCVREWAYECVWKKGSGACKRRTRWLPPHPPSFVTTSSAALLFMWTLSPTATTTTRPRGIGAVRSRRRRRRRGGGCEHESISKVKPSLLEASARPSPSVRAACCFRAKCACSPHSVPGLGFGPARFLSVLFVKFGGSSRARLAFSPSTSLQQSLGLPKNHQTGGWVVAFKRKKKIAGWLWLVEEGADKRWWWGGGGAVCVLSRHRVVGQ